MKIQDLYENNNIYEQDLGWFLNLAKNIGGANVGVNLNKKGGGLSIGKGPVSVGLGNLWKWNKDKKSDNATKTSKYNKKKTRVKQ
jgi:hypothetical protein|tara:strand:+ start:211 stop:465 length:255 start_codon:yes stop_codon:yes gene_type:complete